VIGGVLVDGRLVPIVDMLRNHPGHSPQKVHGGGGSDDDDDGLDAGGEHGLGEDANGVSYTEHDVDDDGNPKFSQSYRDEYGPLESDTAIGSTNISVARGATKGVHVADDSKGSKNRQVVQELSNRQAKSLGEGVYNVSTGAKDSYTTAGVSVRKGDDLGAVDITWSSGRETSFSEDDAFDLQEALDLV
jgi:hypothetical protein